VTTASPVTTEARQAAAPAARVETPRPKRSQAVGNQALLRRLQPKLTVGSSSDPLEQEADRVAEQVMRMPSDEPRHAAHGAITLRRKCAACEEETLDRKSTPSAPDGGIAPASVESAIASTGQPLDANLRDFFEPRFGQDFSAVRVHTDTAAAQSAVDVGARAYTVGPHLVWAPGEYRPDSNTGRSLIAHELAHVVQQDSAPTLRRSPSRERSGGLPGDIRDRLENHFATDFSDVGIHDNAAAHARASEIGARAFAENGNIYFAQGAYRPNSVKGQELLAHELAHVVQQRNGRFPQSGQPGSRLALRTNLEQEAEQAAASLHTGAAAQVRQTGSANEIYPSLIDDIKAKATGGVEAIADWIMKQAEAASDGLLQQLDSLRQSLRSQTQLLITPEVAADLQSLFDSLCAYLPDWLPKPKIDFSGGSAQSAGPIAIPIAVVILFVAFLIVMMYLLLRANPTIRKAQDKAVQDAIRKIKEALEKKKEPEKKPDEDRPPPPPIPVDGCFLAYGLAPGINARWKQQRAPVNGNTTVKSAAFRLDAGVATPPGQDTNEKVRDWVHAIGKSDDDAGHVIANRFGGTVDFNSINGNIFPQNLTVNRGMMRQLDGVAADRHAAGCDVCVHISLDYETDAALRPTQVTYTLLYRSAGAVGFNPPVATPVPNP
jgi:Domain of unknown function (DUF4157)/DNA/RNA non-specific endonuclease